MNYIEEIKEKHPQIIAFEEDDNKWEKLGYFAMKEDRYSDAESVFEKLCLSQPNHHSGYEGLAYVHYKMKNQEKAIWFMHKAIILAKEFLKDDSIDIEVIEEMEKNLINIENENILYEWWK